MLKKRFSSLIQNYANHESFGTSLWPELEEHYTHKKRAYHNLTHLSNMFAELDKFKNEIEDIETLQFSIWYHDIIYNSLRKDNEKKSAEKAEEVLQKIGFPKLKIEKCYQQIMITKTHLLPENSTQDEKFMVDFDLEILSRDWKSYEIYCKQIREEYWMYPGPIYRKGRREAMKKFLDRSQIYQTDFYRSNKEPQARQNILRELEELL